MNKTLIQRILRESFDMKLKDINFQPNEIKDIFGICQNEITLIDDLLGLELYSKIYLDAIMQYNNLTNGNIDIISEIRKHIKKSASAKEAKQQYKKITNPTHIFSADLLKMLSDYKTINFVDPKLQTNNNIDHLVRVIKSIITSNTNSYIKKLLNAKVVIL